jgi:hypothetical protein
LSPTEDVASKGEKKNQEKTSYFLSKSHSNNTGDIFAALDDLMLRLDVEQ